MRKTIYEVISQESESQKDYQSAIEQGMDDVNAGRVVTHEDVVNALRAKGANIG